MANIITGNARMNERSIDVVNPTYDSQGNMVSATLNDAWVRTERYSRESETEFYQLSGRLRQDITDNLVGGEVVPAPHVVRQQSRRHIDCTHRNTPCRSASPVRIGNRPRRHGACCPPWRAPRPAS